MKKSILIVATLCFAQLLLLPRLASADTVTLGVVSPATVSQGNTFAVAVNISGVANLYDYQFDLRFNPSVLSATGVTEGAFLSSGGATIFIPGIDNGLGTIAFNADTLLTAIPGVSGAGTLLLFDFTALTKGVSSLSLSNIILQDSDGHLIANTNTGSKVSVTGTIQTPEPSILLLLASALGAMAILAALKRQ